jgi:hypothetical protein
MGFGTLGIRRQSAYATLLGRFGRFDQKEVESLISALVAMQSA